MSYPWQTAGLKKGNVPSSMLIQVFVWFIVRPLGMEEVAKFNCEGASSIIRADSGVSKSDLSQD